MRLRTDLPGGRRELQVDVGPYSVVVTEVPGPSLTDGEWRDIQLARQSYRTIWGTADSDLSGMPLDPADGRGPEPNLFDARHYLARVRDRGLGMAKLVTARSVALSPELLQQLQREPIPLLPPDIRFWRVRAGTGWTPLWDRLEWLARQLAPDHALAGRRIASLGKLAAFPAGQREGAPRRRGLTAVAWAAIQVLATRHDPSLLYVMTVRSELVSHVLSLAGVGMSFTPTEEVLGLATGSMTVDNDVARWHKVGRPGYWVHSGDAADALVDLLEHRLVTVADLRPTMARLIEGESAIGGAGRELEELLAVRARPNHRRLAALLTRPRLCKYLIPLLRGDEPLAHLSCAELRTRLLFQTRDAPYSCTVMPAAWAASALAVLEAAEGFGSQHEEVMTK